MADCRKYKEMISPYADGELSGNDKIELQAHLEECASCRSLLSLYKSITEAAADRLAEPPDHLTDSVMKKIRMLPIGNETDNTAENKPRKSLRPYFISFVAAAACLALAFIVSPQLFGLLGMSNSTATMPSLSAAPSEAYSDATLEAALDQAAQEAAAKSAEGTDAGGTTEDGAGTSPQMQYGITAATESPLPAPSMAPGLTATGRYDSAKLKEYYAVFVIEGPLPDIVKDAAMTDNNDGTFNIEISLETANQLITDGLTAEMGAPDMTKALVIYTPAQ